MGRIYNRLGKGDKEMKVQYKIIYHWYDAPNAFIPFKDGDINYIELVSIKDYCCKEMEEAVENVVIYFGEFEFTHTKNKDLNIMTCDCKPGDDDPIKYLEMSIKYCPFCGKKIEFEEVI